MRHLEARNEELPAIKPPIALMQHVDATRPAQGRVTMCRNYDLHASLGALQKTGSYSAP